MTLPARYAHATFARYDAQTSSQHQAVAEARALADRVRAATHARRLVARLKGLPPVGTKGLYLVGPVGTGKTHLLAAIYHALHPGIPCVFMTARALFRSTHTPEQDAVRLARAGRVLLLDEVEIDDPANEARLVLTLKALAKRGMVVVATSNVEPERFLSAAYGGDRFRRFLMEEFREDYRVVLVGGDDYRRTLPRSGRAWIGPAEVTSVEMQQAYDAAENPKRWLAFSDLLRQSTETEHTALVRSLGAAQSLFVESIAITDTDDALRLLRLVDDLYLLPDPPTFHFTAETMPEQWFAASRLHGTLEKGIADKFSRTVSRLHALCVIEQVEAED